MQPLSHVSNGGADIGVGNVLMNEVTYNLVEFPHYTYDLDMFICAKQPEALPSYWNLLRPFPVLVWIFSLVSIALVWATLVWGSWLYNPNLNLSGVVFQWLFATLFLQSFPWRFNVFKATKVLIPLWLIFILFLDFFYESNLRAHLIAIEYDKPVDTVQDLLDRGMALYLPRFTGFVGNFKSSTNPAYRELSLMYEKRDLAFDYDANGIPSYDDELKIYQQGDALIINDIMATAAFPEFQRRHNGTLPYQLSKTKILAGFGSIIVPHKAPYLRDLQRIIAILNDSGITQHLMNGYIKLQFQIGADLY
ncbi:hypothetical protein TCAL_09276 [Tigriopus californicus]|uniref:Ionotropic glutamate receptor C-terminal domain-containing protein n=1 Tax=Tigriopus californicus TaxID=6832 RepID=A0A553PT15_TIGCA|nr:hypothetical protein TCAL_09276 [Tigriopus californicus]|eukprot:TCALIF_09276-PA protein Name:"Protein of unknown function" AED:0.48 eAED:0.48 QI:0/0/0/0.33/1/1/3/0/306